MLGVPPTSRVPDPPPAKVRVPGTAAGRRAEKRRLQSAIAVAVGLALIGWLLHEAGLGAVLERLQALGWRAPLVLLPYAVIAWCDAVGWRCALSREHRHRVPLSGLYAVRLSGEAVNSVTPTAAVGGEPVKAWMLRSWGIPPPEALASVVIAKTALIASQSLFTAIGVAALLVWLGHERLAGAWLVVLTAAAVAFTAALVAMQRRSPARAVWRGLRRFFPRAAFVARLETGATDLDRRLAEFYHVERGAFLRGSVWHFAGWMLGVVEVQLMATLIGHPIPWWDALVIETMAQPIRATSIIVPGGLGTQEVGGVWLCTYLGMPEAAAVTLWLLKRARELVFDGYGLVYLARSAALRRRPAA